MIFVFKLTQVHNTHQRTVIEVPLELDDIAADVKGFLEAYLDQTCIGYTDTLQGLSERSSYHLLRAVFPKELFLYRSDVLNPVRPGETVYFHYSSNGNQAPYTPVAHLWERLPKRLADYLLGEWRGDRTPWAQMYEKEHEHRWPEGVGEVQGLDRFERDIL